MSKLLETVFFKVSKSLKFHFIFHDSPLGMIAHKAILVYKGHASKIIENQIASDFTLPYQRNFSYHFTKLSFLFLLICQILNEISFTIALKFKQ